MPSKVFSGVLTIFLIFYSFFQPVLCSSKQNKRMLDIMVIGSIVFSVPLFVEAKDSLKVIGSLIFFYGFGLVIIQKFKEGYFENKQ